jgi:hypothetical protein
MEILKNLELIYNQINKEKECFLVSFDSQFLYLRIDDRIDYKEEQPKINEYEVPILLVDPEKFGKLVLEYNPNLFKVIEQINGTNYVQKIASMSKIDLEKVQAYLQNLILMKLVKMVDIFQFSNIYVLTPKFHDLINDDKLQKECLDYILIRREDEGSVKIRDVLRVYMQLNRELSVSSLFGINNEFFSKVNRINFVRFGVIYGLIRRLHEYPLKLDKANKDFFKSDNIDVYFPKQRIGLANGVRAYDPDTEHQFHENTKEDEIRKKNEILNKLLDGQHCLDEICVTMQLSREDIEKITKNFDIYIISK